MNAILKQFLYGLTFVLIFSATIGCLMWQSEANQKQYPDVPPGTMPGTIALPESQYFYFLTHQPQTQIWSYKEIPWGEAD